MIVKQIPPITEIDDFFESDDLDEGIARYECDEHGAYCFDGTDFIHIKPQVEKNNMHYTVCIPLLPFQIFETQNLILPFKKILKEIVNKKFKKHFAFKSDYKKIGNLEIPKNVYFFTKIFDKKLMNYSIRFPGAIKTIEVL